MQSNETLCLLSSAMSFSECLYIDSIIMLVISIRIGFVHRFQGSAAHALVVDIDVSTSNAFQALHSCRSIGKINISFRTSTQQSGQVTHGRLVLHAL